MNNVPEKLRKYKRHGKATGFVKTMLALKLREIEHKFESYRLFVEATGLSPTIVFHLMRGQTNPSAETIETLSTNLKVHVHELLGAPLVDKKGKVIKASIVDLSEIERLLKKGPDVDLDSLSKKFSKESTSKNNKTGFRHKKVILGK